MITTEYRGYEIRYSENADEWSCSDCSVSSPSLLKVKAGIDRLHLKMRKAAAVDAFEVSEPHNGFEVRLIPTKIIDFMGHKPKCSWSRDKSEKVPFVASVAKRGVNEKAARRVEPLANIAPDTPEVQAALAEANRLGEIAKEAGIAFRESIKRIPRMQIDQIAGLIEASDHRFDEAETAKGSGE